MMDVGAWGLERGQGNRVGWERKYQIVNGWFENQQKYSKGMQIGKESAQFKKLKWIQRPRGTGYPSKRWGHTAVIHEGKLLIYGGNHAGFSKEGVYKIDCETLEGSQIHFENMPEIRESHSCNIIKDSLYIFGGCINQEVRFFNSTHWLTNDLLQFKLTEPNHYWRKIQQKNSIPPRQSHVSLTLSQRHILIYGGTTPEEVMLDDFWLVDLETSSWQQVSNITGLLQPKIGCTMTLVHSNIYVFGGQFGEGDDSQYSSDLYRLKFDHDNYSSSPPPGLTISKMQVIGTRPAPRTGHCCVDYKGKMLIIVGGQGVTPKKTPALYNDLWVFDLRNSTWTELLAQNRSNFRARTNFTANIYKNTIYIFGGFINISNFKSTDDFATITLHEAKHSESYKQNNNHENDPKALKIPLHCNICKFEYNPQGRVIESAKVQQVVPSEGNLTSNLSNVIMAARTIGSCFEALGLLLHSISCLPGEAKKEVRLFYNSLEGKHEVNGYPISKEVMQIMNKEYLTISCDDTSLSKKQWEKVIYSYKYQPEEPGFDLKNSLFRLGKQILLSYLFDDDIMHLFLFAANNIYRFSFHRLAIAYELAQKKENQILSQFFRYYEIDPKNMHKQSLMIIVGSLNQTDDKSLELKSRQNGCDLQCVVKRQRLILSDFVKEYFLDEVPVILFVGDKKINFAPYKKSLRKDRQIEPTTNYFSKIRLVLDQEPSLNSTASSYVKLYFKNRRVGVYSKYPFISGYFQLKEDLEVLNFAKTKCDSWQIRQALEEEIQIALAESRKRQGEMPIRQLQQEMYNPK